MGDDQILNEVERRIFLDALEGMDAEGEALQAYVAHVEAETAPSEAFKMAA